MDLLLSEEPGTGSAGGSEVSVQLDGKGIGMVESKEFAGNSFFDGWDGVLLEGVV